jgi:hypothetical protein
MISDEMKLIWMQNGWYIEIERQLLRHKIHISSLWPETDSNVLVIFNFFLCKTQSETNLITQKYS